MVSTDDEIHIVNLKKMEEQRKKRNEYMKKYMRERLQCKKIYNKDPIEDYDEYVKSKYQTNYTPLPRTMCECGKEIFDTPQHRERHHLASQIHAKLLIRKQNFMAKQETQRLLPTG